MRVLGISGSLRRGSLNSALLRAAAERLPAGAELVEFDRLSEVPPYDEDAEREAPPLVVEELRAAVRHADAVLIATPEYNHSIPGQLKNALDWVSRPAGKSALNGTPAAAIGASTGMFGAVWAQAELRKVLGAMGARVIEAELPIGHARDLLTGDRLELSPQQSEQLEGLLAELVSQAEPPVSSSRCPDRCSAAELTLGAVPARRAKRASRIDDDLIAPRCKGHHRGAWIALLVDDPLGLAQQESLDDPLVVSLEPIGQDVGGNRAQHVKAFVETVAWIRLARRPVANRAGRDSKGTGDMSMGQAAAAQQMDEHARGARLAEQMAELIAGYAGKLGRAASSWGSR
jgi:chromate reductase